MACHIAATSFRLVFLSNFLLSVFIEATTILASSSTLVDGSFNVTCIEQERSALLEFKHGLEDPLSVLDSWVGKDCCKWDGIVCNNQTGNVIELLLSDTQISGRISMSIGNLSHLKTLDLSFNSISGPFPTSIGSLLYLQTLDLSFNSISGPFPTSIGNLSHLETLQLSNNSISGPLPSSIGNLSHLQTLDLSVNLISGQLPTSIGSLSYLQTLNLRWNSISGPLPTSIGNLPHLENLELSTNSISGPLPTSIGSLSHLQTLSLGRNAISGPLPTSIGNLPHLENLDLSHNSKLNGTIPESIGQLRELLYLDLTGCPWEGFISEIHFQNLSKLVRFGLSCELASNSFVFNVSHDWIPIFNLLSLEISDCKLKSPAFPVWLRTQKVLNYIILSNVGISDTIPDWFWRISPLRFSVDLSYNQLRGTLPHSVNSALQYVFLENNVLGGSLPLWTNATYLGLARNRFSQLLPLNNGHEMSKLRGLDLSSNNLSGSIPSLLSKIKSLHFLDLSRNYLSGNISRDWMGLPELTMIDFSNNNLSGQIPNSMCSQLPSLKWLKLSNNKLSGNLESSLQNCGILVTLDLTGNKFSGAIPKCLHSLSYLRLGTNKFTGNIPEQLCGLSSLQVLDLSYNNLSGSIPRCLGNLKQMTTRGSILRPWMLNLTFEVYLHMDLNLKGVEYNYAYRILPLIKMFDLSSNNLRGEIPEEMTNLTALGSLNLSHNHLTGKIPYGIGRLQGLETLDLSSNHLLGSIPSSMTSMTSLSKLNLSFNNLSGQIPSANQFLTFNSTSFEGNSELCGPPLPTQCSSASNNDHEHSPKVEEDEEDKYDKIWLYASTGLGFIVGFWVIFGSLVIKRSWRHVYFQFLDKMKDRLSFWSSITGSQHSEERFKLQR